MPQPNCESELRSELSRRILVIDGAMGTTIRGYGLTEADVRGERLAKAEKDLEKQWRSAAPDATGCYWGYSPALSGSRGGYSGNEHVFRHLAGAERSIFSRRTRTNERIPSIFSGC